MSNSEKDNNLVSLSSEHLEVYYGRTPALRLSNLNIQGKIIAVVGHNGSGKSTLIKTILGLLVPQSGSVKVLGINGESNEPLVPEQHMAFAPENGAVFEDLTVESYIRLWCSIKHQSRGYYLKEGSSVLEFLQIPPLFSKLGRELSKGERRRVQCAVGFLAKPRLFLFDEPFDGLDIAQANHLAQTMQEASSQMSLMLSSHRMDIVERLADSVVVLHGGSLAAAGSLVDVCTKLCGQTAAFSQIRGNASAVESLFTMLQRDFPSTITNRIGSQVFVTGKYVAEEVFGTWLAEKGLNESFSQQLVRPSLHDAMHYHLENHDTKSTNNRRL